MGKCVWDAQRRVAFSAAKVTAVSDGAKLYIDVCIDMCVDASTDMCVSVCMCRHTYGRVYSV